MSNKVVFVRGRGGTYFERRISRIISNNKYIQLRYEQLIVLL